MAVPPLAAGECQVWWLWWADAIRSGEHLSGLLDGPERRRWARFRAARPRELYLGAHALTRVVVGTHLGADPREVPFDRTCLRCGGPHGKPRVRGDDRVALSISHSGSFAVVAVAARVPVGVDVEELVMRSGDLPAIALSPVERAVIGGLPVEARIAAFLRYWTRKEALLKATGHGVAAGLERVTVSAPDAPAALVGWALDEPVPRAYLTDLDAPAGYAASLATLGARLRVTRLEAGPLLADLGRRNVGR